MTKIWDFFTICLLPTNLLNTLLCILIRHANKDDSVNCIMLLLEIIWLYNIHVSRFAVK